VSAVVGFLYISISSVVCLCDIVKSRKMELWALYVELSSMLLCILFMYAVMGVWIGFCCIVYNQNVVLVSCVECYVLGV
jgi:hypothetical protein